MKKNNAGITLVSLVITIIVLIILASISVYSGISTVRSAKLTKFTTELKIMQQKVNELYDSYMNNKTVNVNGIEYVGKGQAATETEEAKQGVQEIGKVPESIFNTNRLDEIFSEEASGITDKTGYRYYDIETIQALGLEDMEYEFFVNVETRSVVSIEGFNDYGKMYYTLDQVPNGVYNVEYDPTAGVPTFDVSYEQIGDNQWKITISNIQYDGYISKWDVKYQKDGQSYWSTSEDLTFEVNEPGLYKIYIEKGEVKSAEKSKALGVPESTPEIAEGLTKLSQMKYGVIEVEFLSGTSYHTTTTPNHPILKEGMTGITYNETTGETTNVSNSNGTDWYSYVETTDSDMTDGGTTNGGNSHWANAKVTVDNVDSYFVWIPRYAYRIIYFDSQDSENAYRAGTLTEEDALANSKIVGYSDARGIVDTEGRTKEGVAVQTAISVNDKYFKTHPAFDGDVNYGGWAEEDGTPIKLQGIWVAKYEASEGTNNKPKSEPGVSSWRSERIGNMFTNAQNYNKKLNSHLMKNSEWGAVAYLTESKYGRNGTEVTINNNGETYYTGGGSGTAYVSNTNQSSTGNVYGIYDLSGNVYEYVAGYYTGGSDLTSGSSFADGTSDAYSTAYSETRASSAYKYGDATYETSGWNSDFAYFVIPFVPFFERGGWYYDEADAGVYNFSSSGGGSYSNRSFRVCLVVQ